MISSLPTLLLLAVAPPAAAFPTAPARPRRRPASLRPPRMVNTAFDLGASRRNGTAAVLAPLPVAAAPPAPRVDLAPPPAQGAAPSSFLEGVLASRFGPRAVLALSAALYGTNFPLGSIMNAELPASAATADRMVIAAAVLSPFLLQLKPGLRAPVLLGGAFVSVGYVSQSVALIDTSPALVSFLGAATVIVCPILQWAVDKKPMSPREAPQTWLAAFLCMAGVAALELFDAAPDASVSLTESVSRLGAGDALSLLQAVGFGVGIYMSEKMMKREPDQSLPITAGMVATTAFCAMLWCLADGWVGAPGWESRGLPGLFLDPDLRLVALAVAWTGVVSTAGVFGLEVRALGRVPSAEAAVLLATEPLWASLFAALGCGERFGANDYVGGGLVVAACLVNALTPDDVRGLLGERGGAGDGSEETRE